MTNCVFIRCVQKDVEFVEKNQTLAFSKSMNKSKNLEIYGKMKRFEPVWILEQPSIFAIASRCDC